MTARVLALGTLLPLASVLFAAAPAHAGWGGQCTYLDAPAGYYQAACSSVCTETGSTVKCELDTLCSPSDYGYGVIVTGYPGSGHDLQAWGDCGNGVKYCCVFDEGATNISTVELNGTAPRPVTSSRSSSTPAGSRRGTVTPSATPGHLGASGLYLTTHGVSEDS